MTSGARRPSALTISSENLRDGMCGIFIGRAPTQLQNAMASLKLQEDGKGPAQP